MARALNKLTAMQVSKAKEPGRFADGGGLYLQVSASGGKSWIYRFMRDGRAREMGLGPVGAVSLSEARRRAAEARERVAAGLDPIDQRDKDRVRERAAEARMMDFNACCEAYITAKESGWRNAKHVSQWRNTLATYAGPIFGGLPVDAVDLNLVLRAIEPIWISKPETASRLRGRIEAVLDWATVRKLRFGDNPARWKGNLDKLLPSQASVRAVKHHAALPYEEVAPFFAALRKREATAARALEFAILTASRTSEVTGALWGEFDPGKKVWIIPPERMKAKREHRVPLSRQALAVIKGMRVGEPGPETPVFPAARLRGGKPVPLSYMALSMLLRRMGRGDITVHGFRSTFKDWCAEVTAFPNELSEAALAHIVGDKVEAAYRRGDLFEKRARMMQAWADYCDRPVVSARVVPIRAR